MATLKKLKTFEDKEREQQKRHHSDSEPDMPFDEDEIEEIKEQHREHLEKMLNTPRKFWPRFFTIHTNPPMPPITKLSPFAIEKAMRGLIGTVQSVKKIFRKDKIPELLVEVLTDAQSRNMFKVTHLANVPVVVLEDSRLNQSKGVIRTKELDDVDEDEILEDLKPQGVTSVRRMIIKRGDRKITTGTYVLIFGTPKLPEKLKLGYTVVPVSLYLPNPLRCFKCQKFGHGQLACRGKSVCFRCGDDGHSATDCSADPKCINCKGDHMATSKDCPNWKIEKEIVQVKHTKNISFGEAKAIVNKKKPTKPSGPSYATIANKKLSTIECQTNLTWITSKWPELYIPKPQQASPKFVSFGCQTDPSPDLNLESTSKQNIINTKDQTSPKTTTTNAITSKPNSDNPKPVISKSNTPQNKAPPFSKSENEHAHSNRIRKGDTDIVKLHNKYDALNNEIDMSDENDQSPSRHSRSSRSRSPRHRSRSSRGRSRDKHKSIPRIKIP